MTAIAPAPRSARALLAAASDFGPAVEAQDLTFGGDLPRDLEVKVRVLHTGLRAILAGRRWYGCDGSTGLATALDPRTPIPPGVTLLCVEGDQRWDRIHPAARLDNPELFATPAANGLTTFDWSRTPIDRRKKQSEKCRRVDAATCMSTVARPLTDCPYL